MTTRSDLLIAIPMKDPVAAKTRLAGRLDQAEREAFALGMFKRTLQRIRAAHCNVTVLVVTESATIEQEAVRLGVSVLRELQSDGLNAACRKAADWSIENGFKKLAILPADLALLSSADIDDLVNFPLKQQEALLCEATDGGTNCLMVSPPDAVEFLYGSGSFKAHRRSAMSRGISCHILRHSDMRFDVDTSRDLEHLLRLEAKEGIGA